jgi:hypothetical protein
MVEKKVNLVFRGDIVSGAEVGDVKNKLCSLFNTDISKIEMLFAGKATILKKDIPGDEALRLKCRFDKTGAIAIVEPAIDETPAVMSDNKDQHFITCPKCETKQKESDTCIMCGVVFAKIKNDAARIPHTETQNIVSQPPLESISVEKRYRGVGGWLLFFCISLTVLAPLATIASIITVFKDVSALFNQFPGLLVITSVDIFLSMGLMTLSVYAGIGLWRIRPGAVLMAKRYLFCFLGYQAIAAVLPFLAGLPSAANEAMYADVGKDMFRSALYFAIWYSYLNKSQRVRATYEI